MKNIVAIFTDLNEFSVKRELLFRYLNSIDDQVYYVVLTNKRLGKINRFYSNNRMIISLGYKENIDRQFVKSHLNEIAYFISSYDIEKVYYCDKELDILSKHFLIQKIDESYYTDILEINHHIDLTYNERSLLIDFSYRDNIKPFEKEVIENLIASGLYKINLFIRKNDRKMFNEMFEGKVKLIVKRDFFEKYNDNFDFSIIFSQEDVLTYLDCRKEGLRVFSFDNTFDGCLKLTKSKYLFQIARVFASRSEMEKIKLEFQEY